MKFVEIQKNDITTRYYKYHNKLLTRTRDDVTGNYLIFKQHLSNKESQLKNIYGGNGDLSNISASFLLKFPTAKYSDFMQNNSLKGQILTCFKNFDSTGVLSNYELDTSTPNETDIRILVGVSWEANDVDAETKANALIAKVTNSTDLTNLFTAVPSPFDNVILETSLDPLTIDMYVSSTILSLLTTYNSATNDTDIEVKTVGLYDHIGVKINIETDNEYRRLRTNGVKTVNIAGIDPTEDVIIATLFDKDYKKLYTFIQAPSSHIQQTQGSSGDILNESVEGSITLDLDYNNFTDENQTDFINTMNSETGGYTIIINVYEGSAIIEYTIIFDITKTQQEINDVVGKLNDDTEIQNIINKSLTMNNVVSSKTPNKTVTQKQHITKKAKILNVEYDEVNSKIIFKTIGSYKHILYKPTEQNTFLSTTNKNVDLPQGFTNKIDVKLVDVNDGDITTVKTYNFDVIAPIITLNGDTLIKLGVGDTYVEQGATVTDDSGETITPVITGSVDTNTVGTYTVTYTATDSSGNTNNKQRLIYVMLDVNSTPIRDAAVFSSSNWKFSAYQTTDGEPVFTDTSVSFGKSKAGGWLSGSAIDYSAYFRTIYRVHINYANNYNDAAFEITVDPSFAVFDDPNNGAARLDNRWAIAILNTPGYYHANATFPVPPNSTLFKEKVYTNDEDFYIITTATPDTNTVTVSLRSLENEHLWEVQFPHTYTNNQAPLSFYIEYAYMASTSPNPGFSLLTGIGIFTNPAQSIASNIETYRSLFNIDLNMPLASSEKPISGDDAFGASNWKFTARNTDVVFTNSSVALGKWEAGAWLSGSTIDYSAYFRVFYRVHVNWVEGDSNIFFEVLVDPSFNGWDDPNTYGQRADPWILIASIHHSNSITISTPLNESLMQSIITTNNQDFYVILTSTPNTNTVAISCRSIENEPFYEANVTHTYTNNLAPLSFFSEATLDKTPGQGFIVKTGIAVFTDQSTTVSDNIASYRTMFNVDDGLPISPDV